MSTTNLRLLELFSERDYHTLGKLVDDYNARWARGFWFWRGVKFFDVVDRVECLINLGLVRRSATVFVLTKAGLDYLKEHP